MKRLELPEELKLENYERRRQPAVFDRLDLVIEFRPGKDNIGAVVKGFLDAIPKHDEIVVQIESQMELIKELKRVFRKRNRLFRNLDSAWNLMQNNIVEFNEYLALMPNMHRIEERIEKVTDHETKAKLIAQFERFKTLEPVCSRQEAVYQLYSKARADRDESGRELVSAEHELALQREEERYLATLISDDHILANESNKSLMQLFPNVHVGHILSSINNDPVENLPFDQAMNRLRRAMSPHNAIFRRYDYRYDPFHTQWHSLAQLREMGVCVEDPLLQKYAFISAAARGDKHQVFALVMQGEDPNTMDLTGSSALLLAAANKHTDIVDMLYKAGAQIDPRDKNLMTPLLYCINRGQVELVRQLLDMGANKQAVDRNQRDALFYAVASGNVQLVKWFLRKDNMNIPEKLWGFSPLHLAASQGDDPILSVLLDMHASIYLLDKKGRTAEEVARENGHIAVANRLCDERLNAPSQLIFRDHITSTGRTIEFWIGDQGALDMNYMHDVEATHVIYFRPSAQGQPRHTLWLKTDKDIKFESYVVPIHEEDGDMNDNWDALVNHITAVMELIARANAEQTVARVMLCDDNGIGISPAMMCIVFLLRYQMRTKESKSMMTDKRPRVEFGPKLSKGLDQLQKKMDDKIMRRLNQKLKGSVVASIGF